MKIYTYKEHDYLKLKLGQSFCFIDDKLLNEEIFFPCILSYIDDNTFRDYINEDLNTYNDYDINNNDLLVIFREQREAALIGKEYIVLEYDNNINSFLKYFKNKVVYNYILEVCNKKINKLPKQCIPIKFNEQCVNESIKNLNERYQNDLNNKKSNKRSIIEIIVTIIGIIVTIIIFILGIIIKL